MIPTRRDFTRKEWQIIQTYRTPAQVQKYLRSLSYNHEQDEKSCRSFRGVVREGCAHCLEGSITAAVILEQHGHPPMVLSLESQDKLDHVVFLFRKNGRYGAISRSRQLGLHGRKPVYRTIRDLVMSYFDPFIDMTGRLIGYAVGDLNELGNYDWRFSHNNVWKVERYLQEIPHHRIRSSDTRYQKWHNRYRKFIQLHPGRHVQYFPNRRLWLL